MGKEEHPKDGSEKSNRPNWLGRTAATLLRQKALVDNELATQNDLDPDIFRSIHKMIGCSVKPVYL